MPELSDRQTSREWYERVLGLQVLVDFPDADGVVRGVTGLQPGVQPPSGWHCARTPVPQSVIRLRPVSFAIADRDTADAMGLDH